MSLLNLQIGQCGNQLGQSFYSKLNQESHQATEAHQAIINETYFIENDHKNIRDRDQLGKKLTPKSLLIDMEPKVVDMCLNNKYDPNDTFYYDKKYTYCKQEGSGNNWSYGYNVHGQKCKEDILDLVSNILEELDFCQAFTVMHSLAGGTGSGLGSFVTEILAENYPNLPIINMCVMPHQTGEVILQSFNSVLTLSSIYQNSNGIIVLENDSIEKICKNLMKIKSPSLDQMNKVIANQLVSLFFPVINQQGKSFCSPLQNNLQIIQDISETLLLDPRFKIMQLQSVPQIPDTSKAFNNELWGGLDKRMAQMIISNSSEDQVNWSVKVGSQNQVKCLGNLLIYRGDDVKGKWEPNQSQFLNQRIYNKQRVIFRQFSDIHNFSKQEKTVTCLSNNTSFVNNFNTVADRAHVMFKENAYLYQYEKFGTSKDDFLQSLGFYENIINQYQSIQ